MTIILVSHDKNILGSYYNYGCVIKWLMLSLFQSPDVCTVMTVILCLMKSQVSHCYHFAVRIN